jgi:hypothetical protein
VNLRDEDAISLLLKASVIDASERENLEPAAREVTEVLNWHALALMHAGAYIRERRCSLEEYPDRFKEEREELLQFRYDSLKSPYGAVYTTFEVSAEVLDSLGDEGAGALRIASISSICTLRPSTGGYI